MFRVTFSFILEKSASDTETEVYTFKTVSVGRAFNFRTSLHRTIYMLFFIVYFIFLRSCG